LTRGDVFALAHELSERGEPFAMVTVTKTVGSSPRKPGATMLVRPDGGIVGTIGGGRIEELVIAEATRAIAEGRSLEYKLDSLSSADQRCGGGMTFFISVHRRPKIVIFGGGHIAAALAEMAGLAGFHVAVVDEREEFARKERFPRAGLVLRERPDRVAEKLSIDGDTYVVIVTHDHRVDEAVLAKVVSTRARYIGMIGSQTKALLTLTALRDRGVPAEALKRVRSPMGLDIGAESPEEIAISILAEMIRERRGATGQPLTTADKLRE